MSRTRDGGRRRRRISDFTVHWRDGSSDGVIGVRRPGVPESIAIGSQVCGEWFALVVPGTMFGVNYRLLPRWAMLMRGHPVRPVCVMITLVESMARSGKLRCLVGSERNPS